MADDSFEVISVSSYDSWDILSDAERDSEERLCEGRLCVCCGLPVNKEYREGEICIDCDLKPTDICSKVFENDGQCIEITCSNATSLAFDERPQQQSNDYNERSKFLTGCKKNSENTQIDELFMECCESVKMANVESDTHFPEPCLEDSQNSTMPLATYNLNNQSSDPRDLSQLVDTCLNSTNTQFPLACLTARGIGEPQTIMANRPPPSIQASTTGSKAMTTMTNWNNYSVLTINSLSKMLSAPFRRKFPPRNKQLTGDPPNCESTIATSGRLIKTITTSTAGTHLSKLLASMYANPVLSDKNESVKVVHSDLFTWELNTKLGKLLKHKHALSDEIFKTLSTVSNFYVCTLFDPRDQQKASTPYMTTTTTNDIIRNSSDPITTFNESCYDAFGSGTKRSLLNFL